jgi:hypothetical protein
LQFSISKFCPIVSRTSASAKRNDKHEGKQQNRTNASKQRLVICPQNELVKNNQMMQTAGQSLAKRTEALIKEYHRQSNIQQTIEALSQAFPG